MSKASGSAPTLAVAIASHDRPLLLRWCLDALEGQSLARERWEVVVAHDSSDAETEALLREHPLAAVGTLRHLRFDPGTAGPAAKRNAAWRHSRAPTIVFTDDDCVPPPDWLERTDAAVRANPGAVVQGATRPDPDAAEVLFSCAWARTQQIDPPTVWAQTCNIAYPRALLEALDGFDERLPVASAEDTDLWLRARAAGARLAPAPEALTFHAVEAPFLLTSMRRAWRWQHLAQLVRLHPELRRSFALRIFWKREHAALALGLVGAGSALALGRRRLLALTGWWVLLRLPRGRRPGPRSIARSLVDMPGRALLDGAELAALARGSARYRTLLL